MPPRGTDQPVKKQSKWSQEEDALIIELRGSGMKWEDISKRLPGRSAISCRLHYQNYLERRSEWDEERKNKLARLYERFKAEMWAKVADELSVPWRAAEAMHWQLGEADMARRAGVTPFSLAAVNVETRHGSPRGHAHSQSQGGAPRDLASRSPHNIYTGSQPVAPGPGRVAPARRDTLPPPHPGAPMIMKQEMPMTIKQEMNESYYSPGPGLPPIHSQPQPRNAGLLPGVAELTTGVSPYNTPPAAPGGMVMNPAPIFPPPMGYAGVEPTRAKRRGSPTLGQHETAHKRRME
ncbi:hypothetical protein B0I35DRAFT_477618 [Stachybotrys elegans]|uniref:DRPLA protein n=1 Tax=Stachybotrys elegans TaxID=80388 RepID=A0A8K0SQA6_9HYPO|nr:hypothetical protein B0I35DRAFT_477618 [Stachybotrys elegans]